MKPLLLEKKETPSGETVAREWARYDAINVLVQNSHGMYIRATHGLRFNELSHKDNFFLLFFTFCNELFILMFYEL